MYCKIGEVLTNYNYSEKIHLKNKGRLGLQAKLSAMANGVSQKKETNNGSIATNGSVSNLTAAPDPLPTFLIILLGGNGDVEEKIFRGKSFIVVGLFEEVISHAKTALDGIKEMITSFGGKVNTRFSKNTSEYRFHRMNCYHINEL